MEYEIKYYPEWNEEEGRLEVLMIIWGKYPNSNLKYLIDSECLL